MTPRAKRVWAVLAAGATVLVLGWTLFLGAVYAFGGVMTVKVHDREDGVKFAVPIPVAVVEAALVTGDLLVPEEEWIQVHGRVEGLEQWEPWLESVLDEFDDAPNVTLVEVLDHDETVRISKDGRALRVTVSSEDLDLDISVPTRLVRRVLEQVSS